MGSQTVRARYRALAAALLLLAVALPAQAALRIVATTPDVADMTRQIAGDHIVVETLAEGNQDPHRVPVKPSFVTKLNRADALVVQGLGLEHAFLPALLEVARNPAIAPGQPAYIDASLYVEPLELPSSLSRAQGELHPLGNPHFNLDPVQGRKMARAIEEGLERVDPAGTESYRQGLARFLSQLDEKIASWQALAGPLRGKKVISSHVDLPYLAQRYGFAVIGTLEYKPGVPATPGHLEELVALGQREHVDLVVHEVAFEGSLPRTVGEKIGAPVATISVMTGGLPGASSYLSFVEANLQALTQALAAAKPLAR
jgi:zinc/manganese transport system substrate-binding protein